MFGSDLVFGVLYGSTLPPQGPPKSQAPYGTRLVSKPFCSRHVSRHAGLLLRTAQQHHIQTL